MLTAQSFQLLLIAACVRRWRAVRRWQYEHAQAERLRNGLYYTLGGKCVRCGSYDDLSIDHVNGRNWNASSTPWVKRIKRYWAEHRAGTKLRLLCLPCHGRRSAQTQRRQRKLKYGKAEAA
jgi:5-methylcytosine-specific restriction endonuclease McrA